MAHDSFISLKWSDNIFDHEYSFVICYASSFFINPNIPWKCDTQGAPKRVLCDNQLKEAMIEAQNNIRQHGYYESHAVLAKRHWWPLHQQRLLMVCVHWPHIPAPKRPDKSTSHQPSQIWQPWLPKCTWTLAHALVAAFRVVPYLTLTNLDTSDLKQHIDISTTQLRFFFDARLNWSHHVDIMCN